MIYNSKNDNSSYLNIANIQAPIISAYAVITSGCFNSDTFELLSNNVIYCSPF